MYIIDFSLEYFVARRLYKIVIVLVGLVSASTVHSALPDAGSLLQ